MDKGLEFLVREMVAKDILYELLKNDCDEKSQKIVEDYIKKLEEKV